VNDSVQKGIADGRTLKQERYAWESACSCF
jgi:hypothetical protein